MEKLIVTIFGATGDLTLRKLLPALENIMETQKDERDITVIAVGRRPYESADYLDFISESSAYVGNVSKLRPHLVYVQVDANDGESYANLQALHLALKRGYTKVRSLFYLAVGPDLFLPIADNLAKLKFVQKGDLDAIIAFEKPFGHTYEDALFINNYLEERFDGAQIYRVDHYLGKEMIQNIIALRFGNEMIDAMWNKDYISEIKIVVSEKDGILTRGAYYDEVGVLNDMIQSHLLQMLALLVMDEPKSMQSNDIQAAKIKALQSVKYDARSSLLGQYNGYRDEQGVDPHSLISTLAFLTFYVDSERYQGVPFYLYTGKKLASKEAYIEVLFKNHNSHLFPDKAANRLRIDIAPYSRVIMHINGKDTEIDDVLSPIELEYCYNCAFPSAIKEAYEILFNEMILGRRNLFPSWEEINTSWLIIMQIRADKPQAIVYDPGFDLNGGN